MFSAKMLTSAKLEEIRMKGAFKRYGNNHVIHYWSQQHHIEANHSKGFSQDISARRAPPTSQRYVNLCFILTLVQAHANSSDQTEVDVRGNGDEILQTVSKSSQDDVRIDCFLRSVCLQTPLAHS